jgi:antitoxin MazE6
VLPAGRREAETSGYTNGMKTAISVPDEVFESAERLARRERRSRSEVYSAALREYVARHSPDEVTEAVDRVVADVGAMPDPFVVGAAARILKTTEW